MECSDANEKEGERISKAFTFLVGHRRTGRRKDIVSMDADMMDESQSEGKTAHSLLEPSH